ncbi:hypothetical protein BDV59DRAFT_204765 [Aspergillus ambiguus]|uniref:uncharacterized protein n=1 Tax=Aspergillus ambiguus TaxID=176160 RepID=UPI003CCCA10B
MILQNQGKGNESGYDGGSEPEGAEDAPMRHREVSSSPLCYKSSPAYPFLEKTETRPGTLGGLDLKGLVQTDSQPTCELLETAHRRTQSMLLASSQRLACQLEDERDAINRVLDSYHRQCNQVLDQLFQAQEERLRLCQEQMDSIRTHHAKIRQELIHRLEANGRTGQKRTLSDLPASPKLPQKQ